MRGTIHAAKPENVENYIRANPPRHHVEHAILRCWVWSEPGTTRPIRQKVVPLSDPDDLHDPAKLSTNEIAVF